MAFENVFKESLMGVDQTFKIADTKYLLNSTLYSYFNYSTEYPDYKKLDDNVSLMHRLNCMMKTIINKELGCRMPVVYPYVFDDEKRVSVSDNINEYAEFIKIVFEKTPEGTIPEIEKFSFQELKPDKTITSNRNNVIDDILGEYHPRKGYTEEDEPYISIDIEERKSNLDVIIYIHELCHALLDPNNYFRYAGKYVETAEDKCRISKTKEYALIEPQIKYNTIYGCCKEETFANYLAYRFIEHLDNEELLQDADEFMSGQSSAYLYGYLLAKEGAILTPDEWMEEKINGSDASFQLNWLQSMWLKLKSYRAPFSNPQQNEILVFSFFTKEQRNLMADTFIPMGVSKEQFQELFKPLEISVDRQYGKLSIGKKSIELQSMHAAFYILLLNHPEGISNANIKDYDNEMKLCYNKISPWAKNSKNVQFQGLTKKNASEFVSRINNELSSTLADLPFIGGYYTIIKGDGRNEPWRIEYTETDLYPKLQKQLAEFL